MNSDERAPDSPSEAPPAAVSETGADLARSGREPALTDAEIERKRRLVDLENKETEVAKLKTEVDKLAEELATERDNRSLRYGIAIAALIVMTLQVIASNAIFVWYGDTNGWEISSTAISAWMGTTVVEVVSIVLVIVNYLFPNNKKE
jgi:hypothetical protein